MVSLRKRDRCAGGWRGGLRRALCDGSFVIAPCDLKCQLAICKCMLGCCWFGRSGHAVIDADAAATNHASDVEVAVPGAAPQS